jgi:hypothetical protein
MPRFVRNFWLSGKVDGSQMCIATGPRCKDGGFDLKIEQRSKGDIHPDPLLIEGFVKGAGTEEDPERTELVIFLPEGARMTGRCAVVEYPR